RLAVAGLRAVIGYRVVLRDGLVGRVRNVLGDRVVAGLRAALSHWVALLRAVVLAIVRAVVRAVARRIAVVRAIVGRVAVVRAIVGRVAVVRAIVGRI